MTQSAILADRRVLPQVWAALLRMALVAGVVQGLASEGRCNRVPVRAVTSTASHLSLEERMGKRFQRFAALQLMAVEANLGLR
jgi:hypothetical protein